MHVLHGYEGGKFLKERSAGGKGNLRKVRILKHVACETLLRVASIMIWEICCGGGGGGSQIRRYVCAEREVRNKGEEAAMRAGPNEETE